MQENLYVFWRQKDFLAKKKQKKARNSANFMNYSQKEFCSLISGF